MNMKRILLTIIITAAAISAYAQPRAAGLRLGVCGFEASYQHTMNKNQFVEGNLGLDFGYGAQGSPGIRATGIYNFIWAQPAWTNQGSWALYAGPGVTLGYVNDQVHYKVGNEVPNFLDNGFMFGICGQVGLEYTFWFPLQLSVDLRPAIGFHVNNGIRYVDPISHVKSDRYGSRVGFYDNGLLGFSPTISVRYRF